MPARRRGGAGEEEKQEEEEVEEDELEEDYFNGRTSFRDRGARDAPVVEVPESYAFLLRDLAGRTLRDIARSLGQGNSEAAHTAVTALFDLPAVVTDHSGRPLQGLDGGHTLTKLSRSVMVPDAIKAEAHASRNRRRDHQSTEGRGPTIGNAALGGGPDKATKACRRAEALVEHGRQSDAMRCLEAHLDEEANPQAPPSKAAILSKLKALHPDRNEDDLLPESVRGLPEGAIISRADVQRGIDHAPRGSAAAMSGWTFDLIAQLADDSAGGVEFVAALVEVYNLILAGKGGSATLWIRSRVVALPKPDGGIRPIAIGEALFRLLGKIVAFKFGPALGKKMAPHQWGVGLSSGSEIISHTIQMCHDSMEARLETLAKAERNELSPADAAIIEDYMADPTVIHSVDIQNAFNRMRRNCVWKELLEDRDAHMLVRFFHWSYGVEAGLYLSDGTLACVSATGLRQGDPLGPLFFALGYMHILRAAAVRFTRTTFVAFIDDTYFICARSDGQPILAWLATNLASAGMTLNRSKSCCLDPSPGAPEGVQEDGSTVTGDGIKVLGGRWRSGGSRRWVATPSGLTIMSPSYGPPPGSSN